jgi:hypothetical protein
MGSEWERKRAAAFQKRLNKSLVKLGTPDLFLQEPTRVPRVVAAEIIGNPRISLGEKLVVQKKGQRLTVLKDLTEVAYFANPPAEIYAAVEASFGIAKGIVRAIHQEAAVVEISIC